MIKNEKQYKIARANLEKWLKNLEIQQTVKQAEIDEYEQTAKAGPKALPFHASY